jgi:hypothetical protein
VRRGHHNEGHTTSGRYRAGHTPTHSTGDDTWTDSPKDIYTASKVRPPTHHATLGVVVIVVIIIIIIIIIILLLLLL